MTKEQIEQNAEEYAKKHYDIPFEDNSSMNVIVSEESYIAGAHSRDEEIEDLKFRLKDSQNAIRLLQSRIDELCHLWISVEERLPEDNNTVLLWLGGCYKVALLHDNQWWECTGWQIGRGWSALDALSTREVEYITHWMPIPKV